MPDLLAAEAGELGEERSGVDLEHELAAAAADDRKRGYNSMQAVDVTLEDMEAYRLKKTKREDPMAHLLSSDEVLEYKK